MSDFLFKKCSIKDLKVLQQISIKTFTTTYQHLNTKENFDKHIAFAFNLNQLTNELENPNTEFYFLQKENTIIGYLKLNEGNSQSERMPAYCYEIERIYLIKKYQGKGFGKILMEKAIDVAISKNKKEIWLGVWEKNPKAFGFYTKMGFEEFGKHIFKVGDDKQLDYLLKIKL